MKGNGRMPEVQEYWDPNEWELYVYGLLQDRHGALNVTKVPARHKGDLGLDYYCLSERVVYQCYAVQEPCEVAERAAKQIGKITTDLQKFCKNTSALKVLFDATVIRRWILTVPLHDSAQVNGHLAAKTVEVRRLGLSYVSADFEASIHDQDSFDRASRQQRDLQRRIVLVPSRAPTPQEIDDWLATSNPLVNNITDKLRKRVGVSTQSELAAAVRETIGWFLERENALEKLRETAPQLHESLMGVISRRGRTLRLSGPPAQGTAHGILRSEMDAIVNELKDVVPNFSNDSAQKIALGTIADWLLRCPLDFPPYSNDA